MRQTHRDATSRAAPHGARGGFTLLELLVVMLVIGIVLGLGLGAFAELDVGKRQALGLVKNVVRTAQNTAVARQTSARVRLDHERNTLRAEALRVIGTWHFEDAELEGAFGKGGILKNAQLTDDGYIGQCVWFGGARGATAEFRVGDDPAFGLRDGFAIDLVAKRDDAARADLLHVGEVCGLQVLIDGTVRGWFSPEIERDTGSLTRGPHVIAESGPGVFPPHRWTRLRLVYDREALVLWVDGVPVADAAESAPVWATGRAMVLGDPQRRLAGRIDNLVISAVVADDEAPLPQGVTLTTDSPRSILFDAGGGLDRRRHREPVWVGLVHTDGEVERVSVGIYGTVDG